MQNLALLLLPLLSLACTSPHARPRTFPIGPAALAPDVAPITPQNPGGYSGRRPVITPGSDSGSGVLRNSGILNLSIGARNLEDSRWAPLDDQIGGSFDYTFKQRDSWIGMNVGLSGGADRRTSAGRDVDAWQAELSVGPRIYLPIPKTPLYAYGGVSVALAYAELEVNATQRASDTFFAGIASAGLMFKLNRSQAIGLEWRTLQGSDLDGGIPGSPDDANSHQIGLTFSAAF